jgi:glycosyltransferase involved in cell wall biosynthesis
VGYFGSLTDSFDQENIRYCAARHPELSFVLIGRIVTDFSALRDLPNVHFLGYKKYEELPMYGAQFDVGLLNWKMTEWIKYSNPLKTNEYLAMGKPVVSVPIDEIERNYSDRIRVGQTKEELCRLIVEEIESDSDDKRWARARSVLDETWESRVELMSRLIGKHLPGFESESRE